MFNREQTWTFSEFAQMMRENDALKEIEDIGAGEFLAKRQIANPRLKKIFVGAMAGLMTTGQALAAPGVSKNTTEAMSKVNTAGLTLLTVVRTIGYWVCIIMCVVEILKCLSQGDTKQISKIIIKYLLAFAACYLVPWFFDIIVEIFS